jgi:hypothetical protein
MNLDPEIVCPECAHKEGKREKVREIAKAEATERRFVRAEGLTAAARFLEDDDRSWPEDGRPVPSDYLNMAAYLSGLDQED